MTERNEALVAKLAGKFRLAAKTRPLFAISLHDAIASGVIGADRIVKTLEGPIEAKQGDAICLGAAQELWPQSFANIHKKYVETGFQLIVHSVPVVQTWQEFKPKPENEALAAKYEDDEPLVVDALWGTLTGKKGDYVVRSTTDDNDIWIVAGALFESTYEFKA